MTMKDSDSRSETLYGMTIDPLPEGLIATNAVVIVEVMNAEGERALISMTTNLTVWDAAGYSVYLDESVRSQMRKPWTGYDGLGDGGLS